MPLIDALVEVLVAEYLEQKERHTTSGQDEVSVANELKAAMDRIDP